VKNKDTLHRKPLVSLRFKKTPVMLKILCQQEASPKRLKSSSSLNLSQLVLFTLALFTLATTKLSVSVFSAKANIMLVCSFMIECFVMMPCGVALCNGCLFSKSRDKIPVKGVVCHTPKISFGL
jgi:hypothetical protein